MGKRDKSAAQKDSKEKVGPETRNNLLFPGSVRFGVELPMSITVDQRFVKNVRMM